MTSPITLILNLHNLTYFERNSWPLYSNLTHLLNREYETHSECNLLLDSLYLSPYRHPHLLVYITHPFMSNPHYILKMVGDDRVIYTMSYLLLDRSCLFLGKTGESLETVLKSGLVTMTGSEFLLPPGRRTCCPRGSSIGTPTALLHFPLKPFFTMN